MLDPGTILAVAEASATALSLIAKYYLDVKNARSDIERLSNELKSYYDVVQKVQRLFERRKGAALLTSASTVKAVKQSLLDIGALENKLKLRNGERIMTRMGFRALTWPLSRGDVDECIRKLERHKQTLNLALTTDQISVVLDVNDKLSQLSLKHDLEEQDRQLDKLPCAAGAAFNSFYRQHEPHCIPDTRVDLLSQLRSWSEHRERPILWLSGLAGTGKSTIARTVARMFHEQRTLGASFFFSRGVGDLGQAASFVPTLAHQLAIISPLLKEYISEAVMANPKIAHQGLRNQWKELIIQPLSRLNGQRLNLILVIDALDECEHQGDIKIILQLCVETKLPANQGLGFFLTSRPETPIRLGFRDMPEIIHQDLVLHDIPRSIIEHDITVYLKHELSRIGLEHNLQDWPGEMEVVKLVQASDCLFIYAATVCRYVGDPDWLPEERLHSILQGGVTDNRSTAKLDDMYTQILRSSIVVNRSNIESMQLSRRFKLTVGTIILLFDVLSAPALARLILKSSKEVDLALRLLHSLLIVPENPDLPIRLLHPSFRDFLLNEERCYDDHLRIDHEEVDKRLTTSCIQLMFNTLRRDMCGLKMPGAPTPELKSYLDTHVPNELQYACLYWVDHLERSGHKSLNEVGLCDDGRIHAFFESHLLHWFEVLSLMGKTTRGIILLTKIELMVQERQCPSLRAIVQDAKRFLLQNRSVIEQAPLQIYASALLFSPKQSPIRKCYLSKLPPWLLDYPQTKDDWGSCLQTLEGHAMPILAVVFSPNGKLLASASYNCTVRLWDSAAGGLQSTLVGHKLPVTGIVFSPDGKQLASASADGTIRLWITTTGALHSLLRSPPMPLLTYSKIWANVSPLSVQNRSSYSASDEDDSVSINAIAFSPNSKLLASSSDDSWIVRLWDTVKGALQSTLEGHKAPVKTISFSPDGSLLVSGSFESTANVILWDVATATMRSKLMGHAEFINAVAFSPDGKLLASCSLDCTVRLWDASTGILRRKFERHEESVTSIAFSPSGKELASKSKSYMLLWDTSNGELRSTLERHNRFDAGVPGGEISFSPDGNQLASTSGNSTIPLWNTSTGTLSSLFEGHHAFIKAIAFSPNSKLLASGSWDNTVRLWDLTITVSRDMQEHRAESAWPVVRSPSGTQLAQGVDSTILLWDATTGQMHTTFTGHSDLVNAIAFSPDGKLLASGSNDHTVRLWDIHSGLDYSIDIEHEIFVIMFSPNGKQLAVGSQSNNHRMLQLWEVSTGKLRFSMSEDSFIPGRSLVFSSDSRFIAFASENGNLQLCETSTGELRSIITGHQWIEVVTFSPDSKQVAIGAAVSDPVLDMNNVVQIWDTATGRLTEILRGHKSLISAVAFSTDAKQLASSSADGTLRLWDVTTAATVRIFDFGIASQIAYDPDGSRIITSCGELQLADAPSHQKDLSLTYKWAISRNWLNYGPYKILWLPPDYRPDDDICGLCCTYGKHIFSIVAGGRLIYLRMDPNFTLDRLQMQDGH